MGSLSINSKVDVASVDGLQSVISSINTSINSKIGFGQSLQTVWSGDSTEVTLANLDDGFYIVTIVGGMTQLLMRVTGRTTYVGGFSGFSARYFSDGRIWVFNSDNTKQRILAVQRWV
ncbi:MAG: hypothetical protein ACI9DO_001082 [Reinekea sp.]|jgi:hypothetical protein